MADQNNPAAVIQLSLDAAETVIIFEGLKLMLRKLTEPDVNGPLDWAFRTTDLLRQLHPVVVEMATRGKEAGSKTSEETV
jgi:hypothetical protein